MADDTVPLRIRHATPGDAELLLAWRNDAATRRWSRHTGVVARDDHLDWLAGVLAAPDRVLLVAKDTDATPVGTVRFDHVSERDWEVSIILAPACRGRGLACSLLAAGEHELRKLRSAGTVRASVHPDNAVSAALFRGAGYTEASAVDGFRHFTKPLEDG